MDILTSLLNRNTKTPTFWGRAQFRVLQGKDNVLFG
ncbi:hypothetical protein AZZ95_004923 [Enterobacter roggenkampii]|nr:hypothetical protein AZZ95_004923 [Enterobacter roggenkampii]